MQPSRVSNPDRSFVPSHTPAARFTTHHLPTTPLAAAADKITRSPDQVTFSAALVSGANAPPARLASDASPTTPAASAAVRLVGEHAPSAKLATTHSATTPTHAAEGRLAQRPNRPSFAAATHAGNHAPAAQLRSAASPSTPSDAAAARLAHTLGDPLQRGQLARELRGQGSHEGAHAPTTSSAASAPANTPATTPEPSRSTAGRVFTHPHSRHVQHNLSSNNFSTPHPAPIANFWEFLASANRVEPVIRGALRTEPGISAGTSAFGREAVAWNPAVEDGTDRVKARSDGCQREHQVAMDPTRPSPTPTSRDVDIVQHTYFAPSPRWGLIDVVA